jgi:ECF sigma factor
MPEGLSTARLLTEWRSGNQEAGNQLFAAAYQELRRLAAWQLQTERPDQPR